MVNLKLMLLLGLVFILSGCASNKHSRMSGSVALKISDSKGIACLFGDSPQIGDKLVLFENLCTDSGREKGNLVCKMVKSGDAKITKMINDHYAEFETNQKISFNEGSIIEISN